MKDYELWNQMQREVQVGNVSENVLDDLHLFKYTLDCHHNDKWNKWNIQARGLVMKPDGTVVARPFPKFFNIGERTNTQPKYLPWKKGYTVYEKMDGSCGIGYEVDGDWRLATPGSLQSDQAMVGTEMLRWYEMDKLIKHCRGATPVFEIIYPANRIVVDYEGEEFLCLLSVFDLNGTEWDQGRVDFLAEQCDFARPRVFDHQLDKDTPIPFEESLKEGYVIRFNNGMRVKAKDPRYVKAHRLLESMSIKGVIALMRESSYGQHISALPKEFQKSFDDIRSQVVMAKADVERRADLHFAAMKDAVGSSASRKDIALWIQANLPSQFWGIMFGKLDNKNVEDNIWRITVQELDSGE